VDECKSLVDGTDRDAAVAEAARIFEGQLAESLLEQDGQVAFSNLAASTVATLMPKIETGGQLGAARWRVTTAPSIPGRGFVENKHSTDVDYPPSLPCIPRVCTRIHPEGKSCSDLGRVLVLNDPNAGFTFPGPLNGSVPEHIADSELCGLRL